MSRRDPSAPMSKEGRVSLKSAFIIKVPPNIKTIAASNWNGLRTRRRRRRWRRTAAAKKWEPRHAAVMMRSNTSHN